MRPCPSMYRWRHLVSVSIRCPAIPELCYNVSRKLYNEVRLSWDAKLV